VVVIVTNAIGQTLITENLGKLAAGNQTYLLDAKNLTNGIYFVDLKVGNSSLIQKVSVNK